MAYDDMTGVTDTYSAGYSPYQPATPDAVAKLYRDLLKRDPDPGGLAAMLRNPRGLAGVEETIRNSPEYRALQTASPTTPTTTPTPVAGTPNTTVTQADIDAIAKKYGLTGVQSVGAQTKGWGFNSPTGGSQDFDYTPIRYSGGWSNRSGVFRGEHDTFTDRDRASLKYVFAELARGLEDDGVFDEADVDEVVRRAKAAGLTNARKVDAYQIDFGLGEGPMQVRNSKNQVWWNNRATEGSDVASIVPRPTTTTPPTTPPTPGTTTPTTTTPTPTPTTPTTTTPPTSPEPETPLNDALRAAMSDPAALDPVVASRQAVPYLADQGMPFAEVKGNLVRIVTTDDRRQGNLYGRWYRLDRLPLSTGRAPDMAGVLSD